MKPYAPPPPPGASPAPLWGSEDHVRELLGDRVRDLQATTRTLTVDHFATPEEFRDSTDPRVRAFLERDFDSSSFAA